jgi:uncharacterized protein YycO
MKINNEKLGKYIRIISNILGVVRISKYPFFIEISPKSFDLKGKDYHEIKKIIKPGDILIRKHDNYLSNYLIPGEFSHAGIYLGDKIESGEGYGEAVIHASASHEKVEIETLAQWLRTDKVEVLRVPNNVAQKDIDLAIETAIKTIGLPYDFCFQFSEYEKFSCSELVYYSFSHIKEIIGFYQRETKYLGLFDQKIFTPDHIKESNLSSIYFK